MLISFGVVGLILSYWWAILPAGCMMGLGLVCGRVAWRAMKEHRAAIEIIEHRLKQMAR